MEFNYDDVVQNLPDCYRKDADSNNYKILETIHSEDVRLTEEIMAVEDTLDLHMATGSTLDMYGEMLGQERGKATDEQYILMLLSRITRNFSVGSYPSVIGAICEVFSCAPEDVRIAEKEEPCQLEFISFPSDVALNANMTVAQIVEILKQLLPVCVTFDSLIFEGTFEFGTAEDDYDAEKGFDGGAFGVSYATDGEYLPI